MNDLLGELSGGGPTAAPARSNRSEFHDIEAQPAPGPGPAVSGGGDAEMAKFFARVGIIKTKMAEVARLKELLREGHERSKVATHVDDVKQLRASMQEDTEKVRTVAAQIKKDLAVLDEMNEAAAKSKDGQAGSASERTRSAITSGLKAKLKGLMDDFSRLRSSIATEYREVVQRRVYTLTGKEPTEEQVDHLIDTGDSENIFQKVLLDQGRGRVLDVLDEIHERHEAVKGLEESLLELHQMFLDMAVLVEQQGALLDNIEKQVKGSLDYVHKGTEQLHQAKKLHINSRKWMLCALMLVIIIIVIVVVVFVKPWQS